MISLKFLGDNMNQNRKPILAGNWKMNNTLSDAIKYFETLKAQEIPSNIEFKLFVPSIYAKILNDQLIPNVKVGVQNMHYLDQGAYTGEISAPMLKDLNIINVLIGHSERREYFNEKDGDVNLKIKQALKYHFDITLCVGEDLKTRELNKTKQHLDNQLRIAFLDIPEEAMKNIAIAYEPIWAIGTGKNATPEMANETILDIRNIVKDLYGQKVASQIRILYGGSVKPNNISQYLNTAEIDGALVGGASLDINSFLMMLKSF